MLYRIIVASLALIPFYCWQGWEEGVRTPKEAASIISLLAIVGVSLYTYSLKPFKNKWLLILMGWCFLTTLVGIQIPVYLDKVTLQMPALMIALKSLFYITLSIMAIVCLSSISLDLKKISKVINFTAIFLCLYGILQVFGIDEFFITGNQQTGFIANSIWSGAKGNYGALAHRVVATLGNPAIFSIFLAMCLPFSLYNIKKEGKYSLILSLIIIAITHSSTATICTMTALFVYYIFTNKKIAIILLIVCLLGGIGTCIRMPSLLNTTGRFEVIKESWSILYKKPLTGMGLGSWEYMVGKNPKVVEDLKRENWMEAHNEHWQAWFEIGIIGLALLLLTLWNTFRRFLKNINLETITLASSFVAICVASLTYFPLRVGPLALYIVIIYGLFEQKIGDVR